MAILQFNQNTLEFSVKVRSNETYTPDDEVRRLEKKAEEIRKMYNDMLKETGKFLEQCQKWNEEHDKALKKTKKKVKQKKPVDISTSS